MLELLVAVMLTFLICMFLSFVVDIGLVTIFIVFIIVYSNIGSDDDITSTTDLGVGNVVTSHGVEPTKDEPTKDEPATGEVNIENVVNGIEGVVNNITAALEQVERSRFGRWADDYADYNRDGKVTDEEYKKFVSRFASFNEFTVRGLDNFYVNGEKATDGQINDGKSYWKRMH